MSNYLLNEPEVIVGPLLLLLNGCRSLILPDVPLVSNVVHEATPAAPELVARGTSGDGALVAAFVRVKGPDGEGVGGIPIGWRMRSDDPWTLVPTPDGDPTRAARVQVPIGATLAVIGPSASPREAPAPNPSPPDANGSVTSLDLEFVIGPTCTFDVEVRTAAGAPVTGATFTAASRTSRGGEPSPIAGTTSADGHASLLTDCRPLPLLVHPPDGPTTLIPDVNPADRALQVTIPEQYVEVHGTVRDQRGDLVPGYALVLQQDVPGGWGLDADVYTPVKPTVRATTRTDANGRYTLRAAGADGDRWHLEGAGGAGADFLYLTPGVPLTWDLVPSAGRWVEVRCVTGTGVDCRPFHDFRCLAPDTETPWDDDDRSGGDGSPEVWCPHGEAVVYNDAVAVRITPEDDVAWLDYRKVTGAVAVRVRQRGAYCSVTLRRSLFTVFEGGVASERRPGGQTKEPFLHVPPGEWVAEAVCPRRSSWSPLRPFGQAWQETIKVGDSLLDLGTIEIPTE